MAKEFDIYLNKRLTECDIIVYSIPFRDGLTATNRMILESCLESYTLQKFIAVETGSELVSHIDKMIKTCNERLHMASTWDIDLEFQTHYVLNPVPTVIEIEVSSSELIVAIHHGIARLVLERCARHDALKRTTLRIHIAILFYPEFRRCGSGCASPHCVSGVSICARTVQAI